MMTDNMPRSVIILLVTLSRMRMQGPVARNIAAVSCMDGSLNKFIVCIFDNAISIKFKSLRLYSIIAHQEFCYRMIENR